MATSSLDTTHYSIKEFQLLVKDAPVVELLSNVVYGDIRRRPHPPGLR